MAAQSQPHWHRASLLGLADPGGGIAARVLANVGPDLQAGRAAVEEVGAPGEALRGPRDSPAKDARLLAEAPPEEMPAEPLPKSNVVMCRLDDDLQVQSG